MDEQPREMPAGKWNNATDKHASTCQSNTTIDTVTGLCRQIEELIVKPEGGSQFRAKEYKGQLITLMFHVCP